MTVWRAIECPHCRSTEVVKHGKSPVGKQRYRCQNSECPYRTFVLSQTYPNTFRLRISVVLQKLCEGRKPLF
jgi:transposase-like protein